MGGLGAGGPHSLTELVFRQPRLTAWMALLYMPLAAYPLAWILALALRLPFGSAPFAATLVVLGGLEAASVIIFRPSIRLVLGRLDVRLTDDVVAVNGRCLRLSDVEEVRVHFERGLPRHLRLQVGPTATGGAVQRTRVRLVWLSDADELVALLEERIGPSRFRRMKQP